MDYINQGLSNEEVEIRINNNQVNYDTSIKTKSIPKIIFYNIFTLFNMLNLILALLIFLVGSYKNLLFLGVVICNTLISTFQEIRTKLIIDKFSTLCNLNICDSDECPLSIKIFLNWTFDILCSSSNPVILMAVVLFISCLLYAKTSPLKVIFSKYISEK